MPSLTPEQVKTFKRISKGDFALLSRGRPRKSADEKFQSITMRIEPDLLRLVKEGAQGEGIPWQSYLKILVKKGLDKHI
jgi:predicted DNA binding CopG/RHH family protein